MKKLLTLVAFISLSQSAHVYSESANEKYFIAYNTAQESKFPDILKKQMQNTAMLDQIAVATLRKIGQHNLANQYFNRPDIQRVLRNQVQSFLISPRSNEVFENLSTQLLSELYTSDELRALYQNSKTENGRKFVEASALVSLQTQQFINDAYKAKFDKASSDQLETDIESIFTKLGFNVVEEEVVLVDENSLSIQVSQKPKLKEDHVISAKPQEKENVQNEIKNQIEVKAQVKANAQIESVKPKVVAQSNTDSAQAIDLNSVTVNVTRRTVPTQVVVGSDVVREEQVVPPKAQLETHSEEQAKLEQKPELEQKPKLEQKTEQEQKVEPKSEPVLEVVQPVVSEVKTSQTDDKKTIDQPVVDQVAVDQVAVSESDKLAQNNLTINVTQRVVPAQTTTVTMPVEQHAQDNTALEQILPVVENVAPKSDSKIEVNPEPEPQLESNPNAPAEQIVQPSVAPSESNLSMSVTQRRVEVKPQSASVLPTTIVVELNKDQPAVLGLAGALMDQSVADLTANSTPKVLDDSAEAMVKVADQE